MLYNLVTFLGSLTLCLSLKRHFTPDAPEALEYNDNKVWLWLSRECFSSESDVLNFKDTLLSNYECLSYNSKRHSKIYFCGENSNSWSLWLDLDVDNVQCLKKEITVSNIDDKCVSEVLYEPLQHKTGMFDGKLTDKTLLNRLRAKILSSNGINNQPTCETQTEFAGFPVADANNLDVMDGTLDGVYRNNVAPNDNVATIILDDPVDFTHIEFNGVNKQYLAGWDASNNRWMDHGTHVCGTVMGQTMGNSKFTDIYNYPVCQSAVSCSWSNIETGYNAAIELMQSTDDMRFVINYSVGGSKSAATTPQYDTWGRQIVNAGGVWVTSAGNSADDACNYAPAYNSDAITVGSFTINSDGSLEPTTWFTNYGQCVDVWSGGEKVLSSYPDDEYGYMSGTSMASPQICGLVINYLRDDYSLTQAQITAQLRSDSRPINANSVTAPNNYASYYNGCN